MCPAVWARLHAATLISGKQSDLPALFARRFNLRAGSVDLPGTLKFRLMLFRARLASRWPMQ